MSVAGSCPSGKRGFESKAQARRHLRRARRQAASGGHARVRHAYECEFCGRWHMTSQPQHYGGGEGGIGKCRACPAEILWARMPSGKPNPLDLATVACEERKERRGVRSAGWERDAGDDRERGGAAWAGGGGRVDVPRLSLRDVPGAAEVQA